MIFVTFFSSCSYYLIGSARIAVWNPQTITNDGQHLSEYVIKETHSGKNMVSGFILLELSSWLSNGCLGLP